MISLMTRRALSSLLLVTFALSACGGTRKQCVEKVWTGQFGLCLASGWEQIPSEVLRKKGIPEETIAAFHLTEARADQRDNIVVSREILPAALTSFQYSEANIRTIEVMAEYALLEKREVEIEKEETILHIFSARPVPDLPTRRFYQLSLVKSKTGYSFTGTLPYSVEGAVEQSLIDMLLSATLKEEK